MVILAQKVLEIDDSEAVGGVIFGRFFYVDDFRTEFDSDVMSGVVVDPSSLKILVKFGVSRTDRARVIRLTHFVTNNDDADGLYDNRAKRCLAAFCVKVRCSTAQA